MLSGEVADVKYYDKVRLVETDDFSKIPKNIPNEFIVLNSQDNCLYCKSENGWLKLFYKHFISGYVNMKQEDLEYFKPKDKSISILKLEDMDVLCDKCFGGDNYCTKCYGSGKLDWVEQVVGKTNPFVQGFTGESGYIGISGSSGYTTSFPQYVYDESLENESLYKENKSKSKIELFKKYYDLIKMKFFRFRFLTHNLNRESQDDFTTC